MIGSVAERPGQQRLHVIGEQRREHEQAPHAVDDATGSPASSSTAVPSGRLQPRRGHLGQEQRDAEADRNADEQRDRRGDQRAVDRRPARRTCSLTGFQSVVEEETEAELRERRTAAHDRSDTRIADEHAAARRARRTASACSKSAVLPAAAALQSCGGRRGICAGCARFDRADRCELDVGGSRMYR